MFLFVFCLVEHQERLNFLCKIRDRYLCLLNSSSSSGDHRCVPSACEKVTCVVDYSTGMSSLRLQKRLDSLKLKLLTLSNWAQNLDFRVAYASERNMFLRTYQLNFSAGSRVG